MSEDNINAKFEYKNLKEKWHMSDFLSDFRSTTLDGCTTPVLIKMRNLAITAGTSLDEVNLMANRAIFNYLKEGNRFGYFTNPDTVKNLQKLYAAFGDSIDKKNYENLAKSCIQAVIKSKHTSYLFIALDELDRVFLPPQEFEELTLKIVRQAMKDPKAINNPGCFFEYPFLYGRTLYEHDADDVLAKLVEDRKVQPFFRDWVEERFEFYNAEGETERASLIASLGGLEANIWMPDATKRLTQLLRRRSYADSSNWQINNIEYLRQFIEYVHYPKEDAIRLAEKNLKGFSKDESRQFFDWLRKDCPRGYKS